jgi:hypothetical protein
MIRKTKKTKKVVVSSALTNQMIQYEISTRLKHISVKNVSELELTTKNWRQVKWLGGGGRKRGEGEG